MPPLRERSLPGAIVVCGSHAGSVSGVMLSSAEADRVPGLNVLSVVSVTKTISVDCVVVLDHQEVSSACGALQSSHQRFMAVDYLVKGATSGVICHETQASLCGLLALT